MLIVGSLEEGRRWLLENHGLRSVPFHDMSGYGLRSEVAPIDGGFIELLELADPERAMATEAGRGFIERLDAGVRLATWCVRTDDLDAKAERLGLEPISGFHAIEGGTHITWRTLGIEAMMRDPSLPFFIEWNHQERLPGVASSDHRVRPGGLAWIEICGDRATLEGWLGDHEMPVRILEDGRRGVSAIAIETEDGTIEIR